MKNIDRYIVVGKIGAPVALQGALRVTSFTEVSADIIEYQPWYLKRKKEWVEIKCKEASFQGKHIVVSLEGIETRDEAAQWTNCEIAIKRSQLPELEAGSFYWADLQGMNVYSVQADLLGEVIEVMETGANPVLVVQGKKRYLIPYVSEEFVKEVDMASNKLIVDWDVAS